MELGDAIRGAGACRFFKPDAVPDELLAKLFDAARFGPQGGNRQPVRYVVVRDPDLKARLGAWYLEARRALTGGHRRDGGATDIKSDADHLADHFHEVPVLVVVCAVMADLLRPDAELDRFGLVGGASIYPSVQNVLLTAREEGLGACLTTALCRYEPEVKELLGIPADMLTAATLAIGFPERPLPTRLSRRPASEVVFADRHGEPFFTA